MKDTVLVVDSDEPLRRAWRRSLIPAGYDAHVAHDATSAVYVASHHKVDAAIVDVNPTGRAGDSSGLALVIRLAELRPSIRIVVVSGYVCTETAFRAGKLPSV